VIRSYRYPLRPTRAQEAVLVSWLGMCCDLYNGALQERRDAWRKNGESIGYNAQSKSLTEIRATVPGWDDIPYNVARSALLRLDRAFQAFFRRCKIGARPGYPRFRVADHFDSFSLQRRCAIRDGRVNVPRLGLVRFHEYRPMPAGAVVRDVIVRRSAGQWWVVFQCDVGAAPAPVDLTGVPPVRMVGIDVGLSALATLSNGEAIANPRHGRTSAQVLAERQRRLARKQRGSANRRRAVRLVQRAHERVANQRLDTARKAAASLVRRFDLICFEDLAVGRMVHGNLARSIHDAGWRILTVAVACKAESAGKHVVKVAAAGTTIECSGCGARVPKGLSERTHRCPRCGLVLCRDVNAARNILARGRRAVGLCATPRITAEAAPAALPNSYGRSIRTVSEPAP
jgi:putative transposase